LPAEIHGVATSNVSGGDFESIRDFSQLICEAGHSDPVQALGDAPKV
jgi:hypothetical protein